MSKKKKPKQPALAEAPAPAPAEAPAPTQATDKASANNSEKSQEVFKIGDAYFKLSFDNKDDNWHVKFASNTAYFDINRGSQAMPKKLIGVIPFGTERKFVDNKLSGDKLKQANAVLDYLKDELKKAIRPHSSWTANLEIFTQPRNKTTNYDHERFNELIFPPNVKFKEPEIKSEEPDLEPNIKFEKPNIRLEKLVKKRLGELSSLEQEELQTTIKFPPFERHASPYR